MEAQDEFRIEPFSAQKLEELHDLLELVYNRPFSIARLRAKYDTSYTGGRNIGFMAYTHDDEVVGYYGLIPFRFTFQGKAFLVGQSADTVVHPLHQGKGLSSRLLKLTFEKAKAGGFAFAFAFPNDNSGRTFIPKYFKEGARLKGLFLPVSRIPWMRLLLKLPAGPALHKALCRWLLPVLPADRVPLRHTDEAPFPSAERSEAYFAYKARQGNFWVDAGCSPAWIKLQGGQMLVGELLTQSDEQAMVALGALRRFARRAGCESLVLFAMDLPAPLPAAWKAKALPDWPIHHADLGGQVDLSTFELFFSDLDSF